MLKRVFTSLPGVAAALLPSVTCPACIPVYAGVLSSLGLGVFIAGPYYFAAVAILLAVSLFSLGYRAKYRRGVLPLICGCVAVAGLLLNKWFVGPREIDYLGAGVLMAASLWNNWPKRHSGSKDNDNACNNCKCHE